MTAKHVIGQKIVKIHRVRVKDQNGAMVNTVRSLELENGVRLIPCCVPTEDLPAGDLLSDADGKDLARRSLKARLATQGTNLFKKTRK